MIVFSAFANKTFDSNSKYLFLYFLKNHPEYKSFFVINNDILRKELEDKYGKHFIETVSMQGKIFALKACVWVISWFDLPVGGFLMKFRRTVFHLGHGTPLKNIGLLEKNISFIKKMYYALIRMNVSYSLASSSLMSDVISRFIGISKKYIIIGGQPRNDSLMEKKETDCLTDSDTIKILYAPTWRQNSDVRLFPFEDFSTDGLGQFLIDNNIELFIRFHPEFEEIIPEKILAVRNVSLFSAKKYPEIMDYINQFDQIITDYSSIYFDYLLLDRPMIFIPYDYNEYNEKIGFTVPYDEYTPGPKPKTFDGFKKAVLNGAKDSSYYAEERKKINDLCNPVRNNSCEYLFYEMKKRRFI